MQHAAPREPAGTLGFWARRGRSALLLSRAPAALGRSLPTRAERLVPQESRGPARVEMRCLAPVGTGRLAGVGRACLVRVGRWSLVRVEAGRLAGVGMVCLVLVGRWSLVRVEAGRLAGVGRAYLVPVGRGRSVRTLCGRGWLLSARRIRWIGTAGGLCSCRMRHFCWERSTRWRCCPVVLMGLSMLTTTSTGPRRLSVEPTLWTTSRTCIWMRGWVARSSVTARFGGGITVLPARWRT
ncbi:hypothetical protein C8E87_7344 [Paractinoplanes brasiliensis]|uniref:Uncharacterized protein n=1 Tax=Paractinoplanes brasiliensis TaxID=52695 RepID=A0A4R6JBN0_9ACTN|nr:hypothetical protein C8E87_7344 [Actinoplanes brasiliensis]